MNPSPNARHAITDRAPRQQLGSRGSIEDELAVIAEELAAARELFAICDPDSPPWSAEAELRRLELRWNVLTADAARSSSLGRAAASREGNPLLTAA
jgi:hypothetical protein